MPHIKNIQNIIQPWKIFAVSTKALSFEFFST